MKTGLSGMLCIMQQRIIHGEVIRMKSCIYLHATVINDYVLIFDFGVQFCHLCTALQKQAVT